jgi:hypothetical protein
LNNGRSVIDLCIYAPTPDCAPDTDPALRLGGEQENMASRYQGDLES